MIYAYYPEIAYSLGFLGTNGVPTSTADKDVDSSWTSSRWQG